MLRRKRKAKLLQIDEFETLAADDKEQWRPPLSRSADAEVSSSGRDVLKGQRHGLS